LRKKKHLGTLKKELKVGHSYRSKPIEITMCIITNWLHIEGDIEVYGIAVLENFSCGISDQ